MDDEGIPPQAGERRSGNDAGGTVGRDVGRDEGRDQATWRDLVARLELPTPVDPDEAPWPDRENLRPKPSSGAAGAATASPDQADQKTTATQAPSPDDQAGTATASHQDFILPDRTRVIRPAGYPRFCGPAGPAGEAGADLVPDSTAAGPRDYEAADEDDFADDEDYRYIPPPLPPQPTLDPVAKGAWVALFGGPGYLLVATLLGWQLAGWTELAAVIAFIAGFVVLVFRLGDGPSKKDGPDQGAVV